MRSEPLPSAIVLAGGRSTRFGSDKLAAIVGDRPLLFRAIEAVAGRCCEVVVVVGPEGVPVLPGAIPVPLRIARDETAGGGPLVGVIAGLEEAASATVIVVGGDMPTLVPAVLAALERRVSRRDGRANAAALSDGDRPRPLPCALRREPALVAARSLLAEGRTRLRDLLDVLEVDAIPQAEWRELDPDGRSLRDVDRPEDIPLRDDANVAGR